MSQLAQLSLAHKCQKGFPFALPGASPRQPEFCDWAFNLPRGEALAKAQSNGVGGVFLVVLVLHFDSHEKC